MNAAGLPCHQEKLSPAPALLLTRADRTPTGVRGPFLPTAGGGAHGVPAPAGNGARREKHGLPGSRSARPQAFPRTGHCHPHFTAKPREVKRLAWEDGVYSTPSALRLGVFPPAFSHNSKPQRIPSEAGHQDYRRVSDAPQSGGKARPQSGPEAPLLAADRRQAPCCRARLL